MHELRRLVVGERRERDGRRVHLAASPPSAAGDELGAGGAEDEQRHPACPLGQVVDEVEQSLVGEVQVLEDRDQRARLGERLEEAAPGGERLLTGARELLVGLEADERAEVTLEPHDLGGVGDMRLDRVEQLGRRALGIVALEDPGLGFHDLGQRPEADALAVGQALPLEPAEQLRLLLEGSEELENEPALADPRHADERDELRLTLLAHSRDGGDEGRQVAVPADERPELAKVHAQSRREHLPGRLCLRRDLQLDGRRLAVVDRSLGRAIGRLVDQDRVDSRRSLEPCGRVDHVAGGAQVARLGAGSEPGERLAGRDSDAHLEILRVLPDRLADRKRRPHRPLGVVVVRERDPEERHHLLADELLDACRRSARSPSGRRPGRAPGSPGSPPGRRR